MDYWALALVGGATITVTRFFFGLGESNSVNVPYSIYKCKGACLCSCFGCSLGLCGDKKVLLFFFSFFESSGQFRVRWVQVPPPPENISNTWWCFNVRFFSPLAMPSRECI